MNLKLERSKTVLSSLSSLGKIFQLGKNDIASKGSIVGLKVLIVDDHLASAEGLRDELADWGQDVRIAGGVVEAAAALAEWKPGAVICDLVMPGGPGGLDLLREVRARDPWTGFIMLTGHGSIDDAIQAIRLGAFDFLTKPVDLERLRDLLTQLGHRNEMRSQTRELRRRLASGETDEITSRAASMRKLIELMEKVARSNASVLITGESGSGKDYVAQTLHDMSDRARLPFVAVNCPAIPETLLESELFGHERGAFTGAITERAGLFEHAAGGTLFLDEITEMAPTLQAKLLRVLETRRFRRVGGREEKIAEFRIFAATNRDPAAAVRDGHLREDLYYRLNVFRLEVPPLRERREDVPMLAARFLAQYAASDGRAIEGFSPDAFHALQRYDWPGNVRELRNAVERAVVLARGPQIEPADLPEAVAHPAAERVVIANGAVEPLDAVERKAILLALERFENNKSRAARALGISLKTLHNKLKRYESEGVGEFFRSHRP
jgi:DNA-binding NtrC family response regulator